MIIRPRRRIAGSYLQRRVSGGLHEVSFYQESQYRRFVYRVPTANVAPVLVRIGLHGGEAGPQGCDDFLANKLTPRNGVIDYAGQAMIWPDAVTTHWVYPETLTGLLPGTDYYTDFRYFQTLISHARTTFPGVPITLFGYSSGSKVQMSWMFNGGMDTRVAAIALLKYTPLESWLTGTPEVFNATGTIPPVFTWFCNNDTTSPQTSPNTTFTRAIAAWQNTKALGITPTVTRKGPSGTTGLYDLSTYTGDNLRGGYELAGSHSLDPGDIPDDEFNAFCAATLGFTLPS